MGPIGFVSCLCGRAEEASNTDSTPGAPDRYSGRMGFLDKLLGKTKDVVADVADKAAPLVDKVKDMAGDHADDVKGAVDKATDVVDDTVGSAVDSVAGEAGDTPPSPPPAAS